MYCKLHSAQNSTVLACCEKELLGKNLVEGNYDVTISEKFYKGEIITEQKLQELLKDADSINLFGEKPIRAAISQGLITDKDIITICGVQHAVILKV